MTVIMLIVTCGWGVGAGCSYDPPTLVTMEKCQEEKAYYSTPEFKDHVQVQCIKQACI